MPARQSYHPVLRTAVLALSLTIAACDSGESPLAPDSTEPLAPESAPEALVPDLLTTGTSSILFSSSRSGGIDIYRMNPDGTNPVRVTSFSGPDETPAWSWDHKRIAFTRRRLDASNHSHQDIYVMNADGTGKRWVRSAPTYFHISMPSWSPDGKLLAVVAWVGGSPTLAVMDVATGALIMVGPLGGIMAWDPQFDPTGKKIIYVSQYGTTMETINLDGSGRQVIRKAFSFGGPTYSPDGKRIAYSCNCEGGNEDVWVRNLVTGTDKRLTTNPAYAIDPTWSPDGSQIAFNSYRGTSPNGQIWTMSSAGGPQVRITNTANNERSSAWSH